MPQKKRIDFSRLETGFEFPASSFQLSSQIVTSYLKAVEDNTTHYKDSGLVPPTALATFSITALSQGVDFPPGSIHVSQAIEFKDEVYIQDTITCRARVSNAVKRGKMNFFTIELKVINQSGREVQSGELVFILPQ